MNAHQENVNNIQYIENVLTKYLLIQKIKISFVRGSHTTSNVI